MSKSNMDNSSGAVRKESADLHQDSFEHEDCAHPAVLLYIWICLVIATPFLMLQTVIVLCVLLIIWSLWISKSRFVQLLRRTRWISFSVFIIYAYASPGELLWVGLGFFSPVTEGVFQGVLQVARLIIVLAGLAILLTQLTRPKLLAGLYFWLRPLGLLGLSWQRLLVRLALTLEYAEHALHNTVGNWRGNIVRMLEMNTERTGIIELDVGSLTKCDYLLAGVTSLVLLGVFI